MFRLIAIMVFSGASVNAQTITETFGTGANEFSIDFVTIGNPGSTADPSGIPALAGSVGYIYNIGKYEVSREMVLKASTAGGLGLTLQDMTASGGNGSKRPATGISWHEAARFVNWLNLSTTNAFAYKFDADGQIQMWSQTDPGYQAANPFRNSLSRYFLPTRDEWYKAAYGSPLGAWFDYANGSDIKPAIVTGGSSGAVYGLNFTGNGPADVDDAGDLSAFGTMAQNGNVWEWMENLDATASPSAWIGEIRGGSWHTGGGIHDNLSSQSRDQWEAGTDLADFGFRVVMVPEPTSLTLFLVGLLAALARQRKH